MIIDRIEAIPLRIPFGPRPSGAEPAVSAAALHLVWCKVTTRSGLHGFGECLCYRAPMQRAIVDTIDDAIAPLYKGRSIEQREAVNLEVRRRFASFGRSGTVLNALAAVDIALWDIAGKLAGKPLVNLLGGAQRVSVPIMASLDRYNDGKALRCRIEDALAANVAAVKVHEADLAVIEQGRDVDRAVPYAADLNNALTLSELEEQGERWRRLGLLWLEDPIWPPESLLKHTPKGLTIALGADLGSAEQISLYADAPAISVVQPDVCMIGGMSEMLKAISQLGTQDIEIAPHTPFVGPAALASLHLIASARRPSYFAMIEADQNMDAYGIGLARWRGTIDVPTTPGLGFDPDPKFLEQFAV